MSNAKPYLSIVKPTSTAEKATRTTVDTILVTPELAKSWKLPPFQRDLKETQKVIEVSEKIKKGNPPTIPGILTLGVVDKVVYILDGQHRRHAFLLSGVFEAFADVRYAHFDTIAEMSREYRELNARLVNMTPDDTLKALEHENPQLARLRRQCPFIGYAYIRRGEKTPVVSMSALVRCWFGSSTEVPSVGGMSAQDVADNLSMEEVDTLISFCDLAFKAWGRDTAHHRLWGNLNLAICMWLYRRLVITAYSANVKKISKELFMKCLMSLAADGEYCSWLVGRNLKERDRSPTYQRIKSKFAKRLEEETGDKPRLPSPSWGGR